MPYIFAESFPDLAPCLITALEEATQIVKKWIPKYAAGDVYPAQWKNGYYTPVKNADPRCNFWEEGFWPGQLWLSYEVTADPCFRELAEKNVLDFFERADKNIVIDNQHDTGFLYTPSCVSAYMLTGNPAAKKAAQIAAYSLSRRFRYKGNFIQTVSHEHDPENYKFIVDTMMNLPLLFWMSRETGNESYAQKAIAHIETTMRYALRPDGTTYHHFLMDANTGEPIRGFTWQGASDDSCWSRGQSWAIYGLALAYGHTRDPRLLPHFYRVTDYFMEHLSTDHIPYWDFVFSDGSSEPRDSSAAAIAACGILEMARHLGGEAPKMAQYLDRTAGILKSLIMTCAAHLEEQEEGVLRHATYGRPQNLGVDASISYGDYFYMEALVRATRDWNPYW